MTHVTDPWTICKDSADEVAAQDHRETNFESALDRTCAIEYTPTCDRRVVRLWSGTWAGTTTCCKSIDPTVAENTNGRFCLVQLAA